MILSAIVRPGRATGVPAAFGLAAGMIGVLVVLLALGGFDVGTAMGALVRGAAGSFPVFASSTLVRATPLILTGLAVSLAFRGGVFNIGADGQLLAGAAAACAVALALGSAPGPLTPVLVLLSSAVGGLIAAAIPAWLRLRFGVLEVISTIMMNFLSLYAIGYLVRGPLQEPTRIYPQSSSIDAAARLPFLIPGTRLHAGFVIALVTALVIWWFLRFTSAGFRVRVIGANPHAAAVAGGVNTARGSTMIFLASGALAGCAGGVELSGVTFALYENLSPGYGFTAIAVALLAGLNPLGVILSAIFLGGLAAGAASMQREAGVPSVLVSVIEALIILSIIAARAVLARSGRARTTAG
jgi:simple sugar transport system permease protein